MNDFMSFGQDAGSSGGADGSSSGGALDWVNAASSLIGSFKSGGGKAQAMPIVGPSQANQNSAFAGRFNSSGFSVSTGTSSVSGSDFSATPWLLLVGGGLLVLLLRKYA